jgi:dipeptidase
VPDDHISVVANMFLIEEMDLSNPDYFLASPNMKEVGKRTGLWSTADQERGYFNFKEVYSPSGGAFGHPNMWYRRTWQIYNLAAPSLKLEADRQEPYPFSIKPDKLISLEDMFRFNRDTFDGSPYDLTKGPAAGPYGNPNRYDRSRESATYSGGNQLTLLLTIKCWKLITYFVCLV